MKSTLFFVGMLVVGGECAHAIDGWEVVPTPYSAEQISTDNLPVTGNDPTAQLRGVLSTLQADIPVVARLIQMGAAVDARMERYYNGDTFLHHAIRRQWPIVLQCLGSAVRQPLMRNNWGMTPLHLACAIDNEKMSYTMVDLLLNCFEAECGINALVSGDKPALREARDVFSQGVDEFHLVDAARELKGINHNTQVGLTPVDLAWAKGHLKVVALLRQRGGRAGRRQR